MRFLSFNKIFFTPFNEYIKAVGTSPTPASTNVPTWYKALPRFVNDSNKPIEALGQIDVKMCVPFRDALIAGYMILTPADIEVTISSNGDVDIWQNPELPFRVTHKRGPMDKQHQGFGMPNPLGTVPIMFAWTPTYGVETDKEFSVLITHPLNRYDLPFVTTSGIIDSGYFPHSGNIPFFIKEGFSGIIPKGTPVAQVIPFRREQWKSEMKEPDEKRYFLFMANVNSHLNSFYSRFLRQPKSYK